MEKLDSKIKNEKGNTRKITKNRSLLDDNNQI